MKFKRFLALALIGTMTISLAACSSNQTTENGSSTEQTQTETQSEFDTMVVGVNELNGIFNPLFYTTAFDSYVFGPVFSSFSILDDDNNLIDDKINDYVIQMLNDIFNYYLYGNKEIPVDM